MVFLLYDSAGHSLFLFGWTMEGKACTAGTESNRPAEDVVRIGNGVVVFVAGRAASAARTSHVHVSYGRHVAVVFDGASIAAARHSRLFVAADVQRSLLVQIELGDESDSNACAVQYDFLALSRA